MANQNQETRKQIAYRSTSLREKPPQYATKAHIEERQRIIFEWIVNMLEEKYSNRTGCYVALKTTVPQKGLLGYLGGRKTREHVDLAQTDGIPVNYRADVLILPIADTTCGQPERQGRTLVVSILTVRRQYWIFGKWEVAVNYDWYGDMMRDLPMLTDYVNKIERSAFMAAPFAMKVIVEKAEPLTQSRNADICV